MEDLRGTASARLLWLLIPICLAVLAGPASAQEGWDNPPGSDKPPALRPEQMDPYSRAMYYKQKGDYEKAVPLLTVIASVGAGYEIAQLELGRCYIEMGARATSPKDAETYRTRGLGWVLKAADAGFGAAQEEMVRLYLDGTGVPQDTTEAAKWYILWRHNPSRMQIGSIEFDAALQQRLQEQLRPAEWQDAEQRAAKWRPS